MSLRVLHRLSSLEQMRIASSEHFWRRTTGNVVWMSPDSARNSFRFRNRDGISRSLIKRFHSFFIPAKGWVIVQRGQFSVRETAGVPAENFISGNPYCSVCFRHLSRHQDPARGKLSLPVPGPVPCREKSGWHCSIGELAGPEPVFPWSCG